MRGPACVGLHVWARVSVCCLRVCVCHAPSPSPADARVHRHVPDLFYDAAGRLQQLAHRLPGLAPASFGTRHFVSKTQ